MDFVVKSEAAPFEHKARTAYCGRAPSASDRRHCTASTPTALDLAR